MKTFAKAIDRKLVLPPAPPEEAGAVKAWIEPVTMASYLPHAADRNPMFLERRVYQGSSGKIYPLPFIDRIASEPVEHAWQAVHLENEYIRVMILPEIGGRIHVGFDKTNGYDFFYRQNVIKPALVGLAGPWISGGVEFNWPQHHRPSTFMPVDVEIERERGWIDNGVVRRSRSHDAHEGDARSLSCAGQIVHRVEGSPLQPDADATDVSMVGECCCACA